MCVPKFQNKHNFHRSLFSCVSNFHRSPLISVSVDRDNIQVVCSDILQLPLDYRCADNPLVRWRKCWRTGYSWQAPAHTGVCCGCSSSRESALPGRLLDSGTDTHTGQLEGNTNYSDTERQIPLCCVRGSILTENSNLIKLTFISAPTSASVHT